MSKIQENHFELIELCKYNRTPTDEYLSAQEQILNQWRNRKRAAKPGRPNLDRIRGVADRQKGESSHKKRKGTLVRSKQREPPVAYTHDTSQM
jgi:hypothetical protein